MLTTCCSLFSPPPKEEGDIFTSLYFFYVDRKIILTHGFIKKTQKTPRQEIDRAKKYREDYLTRKERL